MIALRSVFRARFPLALLLSVALAGCDSDDTSTGGGQTTDAASDAGSQSDAGGGASLAGQHAAVVSDWLQHRLSFIDVDALTDGGTREDALLATLDLSAYAEGPLNAEVTPDGTLALVSVSSGFFVIPFAGTLVGESSIPSGAGTLLFVDLQTQTIVEELDTGSGPMGIAFLDDGARALVAHFGETFVSIVDVAERTVLEEIEVGPYSEEIALDDSGSVGIFSYSAAGNVRTFATSDVAGSLSDDLVLTGDAAGVAFFPGTKIAYVVQAPNPLLSALGGHTIVDVNDPSAPVVLEDVRDENAPIAYPAVAVPARGSVVVPIASNGVLALEEIELAEDQTREVVQTIELGTVNLFGAYGATLDADGRVLLSVPAQKLVIVVDLETGDSDSVPWGGDAAGPTDIALIP